MPNEISVICIDKPMSTDTNLIKLAEFMGIECNVICLKENDGTLPAIIESLHDTDPFVAINSGTLSSILSNTQNDDKLKKLLWNNISVLFVYDIYPNDSS